MFVSPEECVTRSFGCVTCACVCECVCAVSNHNLRHWQQVWGRDRGGGSGNSFQFHLVGRVIDAPVAVEDGGNDLGYLPRYYVNGSSGSTGGQTDGQADMHMWGTLRSRQRDEERETCYELLHATFDLVSFALLACLDHILFNRERERDAKWECKREREREMERDCVCLCVCGGCR